MLRQLLLPVLLMSQFGLPPLAAQVPSPNVETSGDLDNWERDLQREIESALGRNGLTPGVETTWDFDVCIDGSWAVVGFSIVGRAGGGVILNQTFVSDSGRDCTTSKDFNDIDLANADSMKRLKEFLRDVSPKDLQPVREAALPGNQLLPLVANVPFLPVYLPALYPATAACNPAATSDVVFVNHVNGTLTRQNGCSRAITAVIRTALNPLQVDVSPDGALALVASFDNALTFIDTATNTPAVVAMPAGINPSGVAISPDGTYAYVTSFNQNNSVLLKVDTTKRTVVQILGLNSYPQSVFFNPDGSHAYVTFPFQNVLFIIDTLTTSVARVVSLPAPAFGVAFNSTGTVAYIACRTAPGTVRMFDTATYTLLNQAIAVGTNPVDITVTRDDQVIVVSNFEGKSLSLIDATTLKVTTVNLPGRPRGLAQTR